MPYKKKKTQISSLSFLTTTERAESLNVPYQPTPTLGLGDVIYENVTEEEVEIIQAGESLEKSTTPDPIRGVFVRPPSAYRKPNRGSPSTLTVSPSGIYPTLPETIAQTQTAADILPYSTPPGKQATLRSKRGGSSRQMELSLPPALPSRNRRESGVSLLIDPTETAVVYDTLPCLRSHDLSGTRSSSASSIDGSRSISSKTLRMKALL